MSDQTFHEGSSTELPRRRNGRPQACEPCRRRKLACDHGVPVCRRCCRRNIAIECKYLVRGHPIAFDPSRYSGTSAARRSSVHEASSVRRLEHSAISNHLTSPGNEKRYQTMTMMLARIRDMGYFGLTSFSALLIETQNCLVSAQQASPSQMPEVLTTVGNVQRPTTSYRAVCSRSIHDNLPAGAALRVLEHIPTLKVALALFRKNINPNDGWIRLAAELLITSLWECFGSVLESRSQTKLQAMAKVLTQNSERPLNEDIDDAQEWMGSFSGPNMRWECLGILFSYWSLASIHYKGEQDEPDQANPAWRDLKGRRAMLCRYHELAGTSITIADPTRNANSLVLYALYKYSLAESRISGDASLSWHRLYGEVAAIATHIGLHAEAGRTPYVPTATSEARRFLFTAIFNTDKFTSTFTGRPPIISRRYTSTPMPLDLDHAVLVADRTILDNAVARLDTNGWNTDGRIYPSTLLRARNLLAHTRDGILEAALGSRMNTSLDTILALRNQALDAFSQFPRALSDNLEDIDQLLREHDSDDDAALPRLDPPGRGPCGALNGAAALYAKILVRIEHLQNIFFLERLLAKYQPGHRKNLLRVSVDIVALALVFWTHIDRLQAMQGVFEWVVMSYAAPAAGVLCMELTNPSLTQTGNDIESQGPGQAPTLIGQKDSFEDRTTSYQRALSPDLKTSRSNIIQQLSLLVGFFGWVEPEAPNAVMCQTVGAIIQRVLDHTLNQPKPPTGQWQRDPWLNVDAGGAAYNENVSLSCFPAADFANMGRVDRNLSDFQASNFELLDTFDGFWPDTLGNFEQEI